MLLMKRYISVIAAKQCRRIIKDQRNFAADVRQWCRNNQAMAQSDILCRYYVLSLHGSLYNVAPDYQVEPRGPTYIRDVKFLNFFFRQVRQNPHDNADAWPWLSPCGKELNYLRCAATPIVYH